MPPFSGATPPRPDVPLDEAPPSLPQYPPLFHSPTSGPSWSPRPPDVPSRIPVSEVTPPATWGLLEMIPVFLSAYGLATVVAIVLDQFLRPRSGAFVIVVGLVQELAFAGA